MKLTGSSALERKTEQASQTSAPFRRFLEAKIYLREFCCWLLLTHQNSSDSRESLLASSFITILTIVLLWLIIMYYLAYPKLAQELSFSYILIESGFLLRNVSKIWAHHCFLAGSKGHNKWRWAQSQQMMIDTNINVNRFLISKCAKCYPL